MSQSSEADKLPAVLCDVSEQSAALESVTPPESGLTSVEPRISGNAPEMEHVIRVYSRWAPVIASEVTKTVVLSAADQTRGQRS